MDLMMKINVENLNKGEKPIDNAPRLVLRNGQSCVPQHYLQYSHTLDSVEDIIADISFCKTYPIFVSRDSGNLYLQIGVVGFDNYKLAHKQKNPKIVFGRKWRIEPNLPTSEIIQTAFLAIKKAREHEIRELLTFKCKSKTTTPFNNHHDLPLMARNSEILEKPDSATPSLQDALECVHFDGGGFDLNNVQTLDCGAKVLTLHYTPNDNTGHNGLSKDPIMLILKRPTANTLYHALINEVIARSDRYVDETFKYKGFARFSHKVDVGAISQLSAELRQNPQALIRNKESSNFVKKFASERYDTDITRIPKLSDSPYGQKLRAQLSNLNLSNFDMLQKVQEHV